MVTVDFEHLSTQNGKQVGQHLLLICIPGPEHALVNSAVPLGYCSGPGIGFLGTLFDLFKPQ